MTAKKTRWLRVGVAVAILAATGVVYAATQGSLFSIWVDTDGKSDEQVEEEIRGQLVQEGVEDPDVRFDRDGANSHLEISGTQGDGQFRVIRKSDGDHDHGTVIEMQPPRLDTEREPGMTDDELAAKIQAQLDALGLDGEVIVDGEHVEVRAEKRVCDQGEPCEDDAHGQAAPPASK